MYFFMCARCDKSQLCELTDGQMVITIWRKTQLLANYFGINVIPVVVTNNSPGTKNACLNNSTRAIVQGCSTKETDFIRYTGSCICLSTYNLTYNSLNDQFLDNGIFFHCLPPHTTPA